MLMCDGDDNRLNFSFKSFLQLDYPIEEADAKISEFLLDLGRRHFSYGSRPHQMELLGHVRS